MTDDFSLVNQFDIVVSPDESGQDCYWLYPDSFNLFRLLIHINLFDISRIKSYRRIR